MTSNLDQLKNMLKEFGITNNECESNFLFEIEGIAHHKYDETNCCIDSRECEECGMWTHQQGTYGALLERCENESCVNGYC